MGLEVVFEQWNTSIYSVLALDAKLQLETSIIKFGLSMLWAVM